jgi:hypothetical protein
MFFLLKLILTINNVNLQRLLSESFFSIFLEILEINDEKLINQIINSVWNIFHLAKANRWNKKCSYNFHQSGSVDFY